MDFFAMIEEKWQELCQMTEPARKKCGEVVRKVGKVLKTIWAYVYKLRGLLLAIPVIFGAVVLACLNWRLLPAEVGINLLSNGEFSMMVSRGTAVFVPLGITGFSIVLTLGSRKTLYPWMISLFTLVLPVLIYVTNMYPS